MNEIKQLITDLQQNISNEVKKNKGNRLFFDIEYSDFVELIKLESELIFAERLEFGKNGNVNKFIIDEFNEPVLKKLYNWLTKKDFNGNLYKGILLMGQYGTGKTIILTSLLKVYEKLSSHALKCQKMEIIWSRQLNEIWQEKGYSYFEKRPLMIDELAKEKAILKEYGNTETPMINILLRRYDTGALTFATSNFDLKDLQDIYKETLADRLSSMFNIIELTGKSKRK